MIMQKCIPKSTITTLSNVKTVDNGEKLISISNAGILCKPIYFLNNIPNSLSDCYARESIIEKLLYINKNLPNGYQLLIYDAYRPIAVQQELWNSYEKIVKEQNPNDNIQEIENKTSIFVSKPSYDILNPSIHNTGGAIDLTIVDKFGHPLNMGTEFDDFTEKSNTNHFEYYANEIISEEIRRNRRLLYWSMINAGFVNLPSEWWHYDFGDKIWATENKCNAIYGGIL